jgi:hypothetical protein
MFCLCGMLSVWHDVCPPSASMDSGLCSIPESFAAMFEVCIHASVCAKDTWSSSGWPCKSHSGVSYPQMPAGIKVLPIKNHFQCVPGGPGCTQQVSRRKSGVEKDSICGPQSAKHAATLSSKKASAACFYLAFLSSSSLASTSGPCGGPSDATL